MRLFSETTSTARASLVLCAGIELSATSSGIPRGIVLWAVNAYYLDLYTGSEEPRLWLPLTDLSAPLASRFSTLRPGLLAID